MLFPVKGPIYFPWNVILTALQLQLSLPPSHMNDFTQRLVLIQRHKATLAEMGNCALLVLNAVSVSHRGRCSFLCSRVKDVFSESGHETEYRKSLAHCSTPQQLWNPFHVTAFRSIYWATMRSNSISSKTAAKVTHVNRDQFLRSLLASSMNVKIIYIHCKSVY